MCPFHCCHFFGLLGVLMVQSENVTGVVLVEVRVAGGLGYGDVPPRQMCQ